MKNNCIEKRTTKTLRFLKDKNPGACLFTRDFHGAPAFGGVWIKKFMENPVEYYLDKKKISGINDEYLKSMRRGSGTLTELDDDSVPDIALDFSQGASVSLLCGLAVKFVSDTGWCKPEFTPEEINLSFRPDNPWVQFHLMICEDLIKKWDGDFLLLPIIHRSPLDAANALLGDKIFLMMYDDPETVLNISMACAQWSLEFEDFINSNLKWPADLHRGLWELALPDNSVAVNGDPVDLISSELQQYFDRPSSEKLFTGTGGGYFHHHALGIRQVVNLSYTKGMLIQQITDDPNVAFPASTLITDKDIRDMTIDASLRTPILLFGNFLPYIDKLIPIMKKGCFILRQTNKDAPGVLKKLRAASLC